MPRHTTRFKQQQAGKRARRDPGGGEAARRRSGAAGGGGERTHAVPGGPDQWRRGSRDIRQRAAGAAAAVCSHGATTAGEAGEQGDGAGRAGGRRGGGQKEGVSTAVKRVGAGRCVSAGTVATNLWTGNWFLAAKTVAAIMD